MNDIKKSYEIKTRSKLGKIRNVVITEDSKCEICGSKDDLQLHHIIPINMFGDNRLDNLTVLCRKCHAAVHKSYRNVKDQKAVYEAWKSIDSQGNKKGYDRYMEYLKKYVDWLDFYELVKRKLEKGGGSKLVFPKSDTGRSELCDETGANNNPPSR